MSVQTCIQLSFDSRQVHRVFHNIKVVLKETNGQVLNFWQTLANVQFIQGTETNTSQAQRDTYRYAQHLWVHRHSEGQRLWILSVERFECGHQGLTKLLGLEDWEEIER